MWIESGALSEYRRAAAIAAFTISPPNSKIIRNSPTSSESPPSRASYACWFSSRPLSARAATDSNSRHAKCEVRRAVVRSQVFVQLREDVGTLLGSVTLQDC